MTRLYFDDCGVIDKESVAERYKKAYDIDKSTSRICLYRSAEKDEYLNIYCTTEAET